MGGGVTYTLRDVDRRMERNAVFMYRVSQNCLYDLQISRLLFSPDDITEYIVRLILYTVDK